MMTTKRSKKRNEYTGPGGAEEAVEKATKEEFQIAKWLRSNVPTKKTKFLNHNVEYFTSAKALDALMLSEYAQGDNCQFPHRQAAIDFLDNMLNHQFFHRAKKVPVSEQELKGRGKKGEKDAKPIKEKDEKNTDAESSHAEGKLEKISDKEKRKRKIRLEMHPQQIYVDGHEAYVWIYDPIPMHYWVFGALLVIGAIIICLFPLWPPSLRKGVYYLSVAAAGFLVFILSLAVIRFVVFCIIWLFTGGKHHFWLLPNLTEDVGFVASFWPLYKHECKDGKDNSSKKQKKRKRSDEDDDSSLLENEQIENIKEHDAEEEMEILDKKPVVRKQIITDDTIPEKLPQTNLDDNIDRKDSASESESEGSQRSSTGKDFEIVDPEDVETS